jgi:hypothetical protein
MRIDSANCKFRSALARFITTSELEEELEDPLGEAERLQKLFSSLTQHQKVNLKDVNSEHGQEVEKWAKLLKASKIGADCVEELCKEHADLKLDIEEIKKLALSKSQDAEVKFTKLQDSLSQLFKVAVEKKGFASANYEKYVEVVAKCLIKHASAVLSNNEVDKIKSDVESKLSRRRAVTQKNGQQLREALRTMGNKLGNHPPKEVTPCPESKKRKRVHDKQEDELRDLKKQKIPKKPGRFKIAEWEKLLSKATVHAEKIVNQSQGYNGDPTNEQCGQVLGVQNNGKPYTKRMELGKLKEAEAQSYIDNKLKETGKEEVIWLENGVPTIGKIGFQITFDKDGTYLGENQGMHNKDSIQPDVVLWRYNNGNHKVLKIYDFKFPCPSTNKAQWRTYEKGKYKGKSQGDVYQTILKVKQAKIVSPRGLT